MRNMKNSVLLVFVVIALVAGIVFVTGCQKKGEVTVVTTDTNALKVVFYVHGTLGDKSFMDSAARGMNQAIDQLGIVGKIVEGGTDPSRWEPDIIQLSEGDWDIIVTGTWQVADIIDKVASTHTDKKYFVFDTVVEQPNVYSMLFSQNESSFLTGALAALLTESDLPLSNDDLVVGFLGGLDIPVINDFKIGFIEGVAYINPNTKVLVSYAGSFNDPAKGKELTLAMYDQGADITFNVAGETGLGGIDAAKDAQKYTIGVDSDQYELFIETDPEKAANIVTSMMKNVDLSIYRGIQRHLDGTIEYGVTEVLNVEKGGVGLADNKNYKTIVSAEIRSEIEEIAGEIASGEITVGTAFGN